jgi:hypothetical protein
MDGEFKVLTKYLKPDLLIIDDMGMKHLPKGSGEYVFEIVMRRHETRSTMMTSNELRVFALRSRRKNLVGLNRVGSTWGFYGDERGRWHASMARCG